MFIVSCGKNLVGSADGLSDPHADSDLDGISNLEEAQRGTDPFMNKDYVNNYLGSNNTKIKFRLRAGRDYGQSLSFLTLKESREYFYEYALLEKIYRPIYQDHFNLKVKKEKLAKDILFMNVYACISKMQLNALKVKYGSYEINQTDIYTDLLRFKGNEKTNFYLYDFKSIDDIFFYKKNNRYESYGHRLSAEAMENGFCILYNKLDHNKQSIFSTLSKLIKINDTDLSVKNAIEFALYKSEVYSEGILSKRLMLSSFDTNEDNIFFYNKLATKYSQIDIKEITNNTSLSDYEVGDYIEIYDYIKSNIRNQVFYVRNAKGTSCNTNGERGTKCRSDDKGACKVYQKPEKKSLGSYKSLMQMDLYNFKLKVNNEFFAPVFVTEFFAVYKFRIKASHLKNDHLSIALANVSKDKYEYKTILYTSSSKSRRGYRYSCREKINKKASSKNVMEFEHKLIIKRAGEYR